MYAHTQVCGHLLVHTCQGWRWRKGVCLSCSLPENNWDPLTQLGACWLRQSSQKIPGNFCLQLPSTWITGTQLWMGVLEAWLQVLACTHQFSNWAVLTLFTSICIYMSAHFWAWEKCILYEGTFTTCLNHSIYNSLAGELYWLLFKAHKQLELWWLI